MHVSLDTIADTIPLTTQEKTRLAELEGIVQTHLQAFLAVQLTVCVEESVSRIVIRIDCDAVFDAAKPHFLE
jgi:hypothetical protein